MGLDVENSMGQLRYDVLEQRDERLQIQAIRTLVRIGGTRAVTILTERLFDLSGHNPIRAAVRGLGHLVRDGGLLALTSTLLIDDRYLDRKFQVLVWQIRALGYTSLAEYIQKRLSDLDFEDLDCFYSFLHTLSLDTFADLAHGVVLCWSAPAILCEGRVHLPLDNLRQRRRAVQCHFSKSVIMNSMLYTHQRIPGLIELLERSEPHY